MSSIWYIWNISLPHFQLMWINDLLNLTYQSREKCCPCFLRLLYLNLELLRQCDIFCFQIITSKEIKWMPKKSKTIKRSQRQNQIILPNLRQYEFLQNESWKLVLRVVSIPCIIIGTRLGVIISTKR